MAKKLFTSESVTEGHPDKICDQISDAVLDAILEKDPMARVACETTVTTGLIHVMGEITTNCYVDIPRVARDVVRDIGYDRAKFGFDCDTCAVITSIDEQSPDIALGVDVRSGEELPYLETIIRKWRENKYPFSILFLDSSDEVLIKRFKETRRSHPLSRNGRVEKGIELEREKLAFLKKEADQVIDTSRLLTKELRHELENLYSGADGCSSMFITVLSFGFKYGIPVDADLVFDVRFLPNPYYVEELRFHTGTEQAVQDYVMQGGTGEEFLKKLNDLLEFVIPKYEQEGKTQLVIAIGCTGGRHRSVTIAGEVFKRLTESGRYEIRLEHRDAGKDGGK